MHTGCRLSTAPRPLSHRVHMVSFLFACLLWRHVYRNRALWYKELEDSGQKTCIKPHEPHPSPSVFRGTEADADNPSAIRFHSAFLLFFVLFAASSASDTHRPRLVFPALYPNRRLVWKNCSVCCSPSACSLRAQRVLANAILKAAPGSTRSSSGNPPDTKVRQIPWSFPRDCRTFFCFFCLSKQ